MLKFVRQTAIAAVAATLFGAPAMAETVVNFAGYSGLFQDLYTKAVIEPFMRPILTSRWCIRSREIRRPFSASCVHRRARRNSMSR